jgi:hypothetical protein
VSAKDEATKSHATRDILRGNDNDGRPADAGDFLEALKREHPERWAKIELARKTLADALEPPRESENDQPAGESRDR